MQGASQEGCIILSSLSLIAVSLLALVRGIAISIINTNSYVVSSFSQETLAHSVLLRAPF